MVASGFSSFSAAPTTCVARTKPRAATVTTPSLRIDDPPPGWRRRIAGNAVPGQGNATPGDGSRRPGRAQAHPHHLGPPPGHVSVEIASFARGVSPAICQPRRGEDGAMSIPGHKAFPAAVALAFWIGASAPAAADPVSAADTQGLQTRPIRLGVSGSSKTLLLIRSLLYCYTGTLGALVEDAAQRQYVLSNNHVLAKENENLKYGSAVDNATIIQPGLLDEAACSTSLGDPAHAVADLSTYVPILSARGKTKPSNTADV